MMHLLLTCIFADNWKSQYLKKGEVTPGVQAGEYDGEVRSDITTSFFILLAIFFPSVTGRLAVKKGSFVIIRVCIRLHDQ